MHLAIFTASSHTFSLRRAELADLDAILALLSNDPLRRAQMPLGAEHRAAYLAAFRTIDADPAHLLVVVADGAGTVVGTLQLTLVAGLSRGGATRLLVEAVRVADAVRGLGVGTAMMQWAAEEGRRRGASLVQLTSDAARPDAHRFYERLGYTASHVGFKLFLS